MRARHIAFDATLKSSLVRLFAAGLVMALVLLFAAPVVASMLSSVVKFRNESELLVLALLGGVVYGALVLALFGRRWLSLLSKRAQSAPAASIDALSASSVVWSAISAIVSTIVTMQSLLRPSSVTSR